MTEAAERYLGGLSSSKLSKGPLGYGIYVTNKRLFGVRNWKAFASYMGAALLSPAMGLVILNQPSDEGARTIQKLEQEKDFVLIKEEISKLEILKPGFITNGYLKITQKSGKYVKIRFHGRSEFEMIKDLMNAFNSEAVKLV
jgi:hypothetical protein